MTNQTTTPETQASEEPVEKEAGKSVPVKEGLSAEKLARRFYLGSPFSAQQVARLVLYSMFSLMGRCKTQNSLPSVPDIINAQMDDDLRYIMGLRAGRCGTWLEEQRIMCLNRVKVAFYLLKAQTTSLISSIERAGFAQNGAGDELQASLQKIRQQMHRLDITPEPFCTKETRGSVLSDVRENIHYTIAFNYAAQLVAEYTKIPAVLTFRVSMQDVEAELSRVSMLETLVKQYAPDECLDLPADFIVQSIDRIQPETHKIMQKCIKDLTVFDGCLVFSPSAPLLKQAYKDMQG